MAKLRSILNIKFVLFREIAAMPIIKHILSKTIVSERNM